MAWYAIPNNGLMGRIARFVGMAERHDDGAPETVAVDGMHELRRYWRREGRDAYYSYDRRTCDEVLVGRYGSDSQAIDEWRWAMREGEL